MLLVLLPRLPQSLLMSSWALLFVGWSSCCGWLAGWLCYGASGGYASFVDGVLWSECCVGRSKPGPHRGARNRRAERASAV
ncbi:uncharacterized protein LY79DRAFT_543618 [Colletotrichum navitas]|uniref:Uncharacterized protein n=1 Tax=Colletotrichum navitas TaxID=681940 RepID=A0AAD8V6Z1_9PEZI|nr:uncharacterized protein LY79DRAFT_543618 [Colletotrichum navitas]KAK1596582.1 hypothetical protein LY79DRAFT_543618 [Colletotrichum navitas]